MATDAHRPSERPAIYVAGPLGFTAAGSEYLGRALLPSVEDAGLRPLNPWKPDDPDDDPFARASAIEDHEARLLALTEANAGAGARNERLLRECVAVLAVLDGSDVDSGTASEIGFAAALAIPSIGLRTDFRLASDNEAAVVNLQVEYFIRSRGGCICTTLETAVERLAAVVDERIHRSS
jgi:nucleoside 2-deoxyribosyltransferase